MSDLIDITGLDKAELLAALFNASRPLGMGFLQPHEEAMSTEEAANLLKGADYFDYVRGRVLKVHLGKDKFDPALYNRDNGLDAAEKIVAELIIKKEG